MKKTTNIFKECISLSMLSLHNNPIYIKDIIEIEGYEGYEGRRRRHYDKKLDNDAMAPGETFDEGGDYEK